MKLSKNSKGMLVRILILLICSAMAMAAEKPKKPTANGSALAGGPQVLIDNADRQAATWRYTTDEPAEAWNETRFDDSP